MAKSHPGIYTDSILRAMIETRRTFIRSISALDEPDLFDIYRKSEVFEHFGVGPYTREKHRESVGRAVERWNTSGKGDLVAEFQGVVIARLIFFTENHDEYEIGYAVHPSYWGKGFATEIARGLLSHAIKLEASSIAACARATNLRSRHILSKLDFTEINHETGEDNIERIWYRYQPLYG